MHFLVEISDEKSRQEAANFDHSKMKHVETVEKTALPTSDGKLSHLFYFCCTVVATYEQVILVKEFVVYICSLLTESKSKLML